MDGLELKYHKCRFCKNNPYAKNGKRIVTNSKRYSSFYTDKKEKEEISRFWSTTLNDLLNGSEKINTDDFFNAVEKLKEAMEKKAKGKIAHFSFYDALRSFSVALKYRWCDEKTASNYKEPPLCPLSEPVLGLVGDSIKDLDHDSITRENAEIIYAFLKKKAEEEDLSISQWELKYFNLYQAENHGLL